MIDLKINQKSFNYLKCSDIIYCLMALCFSGAEVDGLIVDTLQAFGQALKVLPPCSNGL